MKTRFIAVIFGRAGFGKTYLIKQLLPLMPRPVFILDTMNEFSEGLIFTNAQSLLTFVKYGGRNDSGVYILKSDDDADSDLFFHLFPTVKEPATIVVDEVSKFCNPNFINEDLKRIINYGRHWSQNLVMAARRSAEVHRDVTAQADVIVSFRQTERRDITKMSEVFNEAERLPELEKGQFVVIGDPERTPFESFLVQNAIK
jgi:hypothetical protein